MLVLRDVLAVTFALRDETCVARVSLFVPQWARVGTFTLRRVGCVGCACFVWLRGCCVRRALCGVCVGCVVCVRKWAILAALTQG